MGDGGIDNKLKPHYNNNRIELKNKVLNSFSKIFGEFRGHTKDTRKQQIYFPKIVGIILAKGLGFVQGRKTALNQEIPYFLLNTNNKIKAAFIQQLYDDEGWVYFKEESSHRSIGIKFANKIDKTILKEELKKNPKMYCPLIIWNLIEMLKSFDIEPNSPECHETYITKKGIHNAKWLFMILHKDNLTLFYNQINFSLDYKKNKLKNAIDTYYNFGVRNSNYWNNIKKVCLSINNEIGNITTKNLSNYMKVSNIRTKQIIKRLRNENFLTLKKLSISRYCAEYIINKNV